MAIAPSRDGVETVAVGDRRADAQEQNLVELVLAAFRLARVLDPRKMMQKKAQPRRLLKFVDFHHEGSNFKAPIDSALPRFVNRL
jgi:hypothetical protein